MRSNVQTLIQLMQQVDEVPNDIRFFLLDKQQVIRCVRGRLSIQAHQQEFAYIDKLILQRGAMLEIFAMLEGFVNEFFHLKFFGLTYQQADEFDEVLEFIDFNGRTRLLRRWEMISRGIAEKITAITSVRNYLAHAWDVQAATYKRQPLADPAVFQRFQTDLRKIFESLIQQYQKEQQQHDFDAYLERLIKKIMMVNDETSVP